MTASDLERPFQCVDINAGLTGFHRLMFCYSCAYISYLAGCMDVTQMPIRYSIDEDLGVVFTTASDVLTEDELIEHKRKVISDPNFKPGFVELSDVRFISDLEISASGLERFVAQDDLDSERLKNFKLAIVVSGALEFGMGVMYEMMSQENNRNVRIFRDLRLAKEWLQIPK